MIINKLKLQLGRQLLPIAAVFSLMANAQMGASYLPDYNIITTAASPASPEVIQRVNTTLEDLKNDPVLRNADWGFALYNPETDKMIAAYNAHLPLVPASTTKLLTTDTAYSLLGENFRFDTQMEYSGSISEDGILHGDLFIVGSGDPSLGINHAGAPSYWRLIQNFKEVLKEVGIKKIQGDIVIETAVFDTENRVLPPNIVWKKHNNYFLPVGNTDDLTVDEEYILENKHQTRQGWYYYISPTTGKLSYIKAFDNSEHVDENLPDAPAFLAKLFRKSLIKDGISVGNIETRGYDPNPEERHLLRDYKSPKLEDIIYFTNQTSNNRLAENLMKLAGYYTFGELSKTSGRRAVKQHLHKVDFDFRGFHYIDGSGLSHSHRVTPVAQVKFLADLMQRPYYESFYQSLPIGGLTGTLKSMFENDYSTGKIMAKTGTLRGVKALAGYINTSTGKRLTFSILVKGYAGSIAQVKKKMEELLAPTIDL